MTHTGFVGAMQLISDSGSALAWQIVLAGVVVWLLWRRLPRLALFVVITAPGSSLLRVFLPILHGGWRRLAVVLAVLMV